MRRADARERLFGVSKSAAGRIIDHLAPSLALQPRNRFRRDTVLFVDGTLVPTPDHTDAEQPKDYRYSTNHQAGASVAAAVIADGGYRGTGLVIPHRREPVRPDSRTGKRNTTPPTAKSEPASSTSSPA